MASGNSGVDGRLPAAPSGSGGGFGPTADGARMPLPGHQAIPSPVLAATYDAPGRQKRKRTAADRLGALFVGAVTLAAVLFAAAGVYDRIHREMVRPAIAGHWERARQVLAVRLRQQPDPLEFGAVWATHSGMICGLVNGRGSFGGLAGMTPFAVEGDRTVFAFDQSALNFAPYWRDCMTDQWIKVLDGSMQAGGCATTLGQQRCVTVGG